MTELLMIMGMAAVTFSIRFTLWSSDRMRLPTWLTDALTFAPAAVLTAIIVPMVIYPEGGNANYGFDNPYLIAISIAFVIALWCKNLLLTISLGMMTFLVLRWLAF